MGSFLIFNQNRNRKGTDKDEERLVKCWKKFNFVVESFQNLTNKDILEKITVFSNKINENHKMLAICILAHGNEYGVSDSRSILSTADIINTINKIESLKNNPKLLIIQSCRGVQKQYFLKNQTQSCSGNQTCYVTDAVKEDDHSSNQHFNAKNILIYHSTVLSYFSHRDEDYGTPFIENLCDCVEKYYKQFHLSDIFIMANRAAHNNFSKHDTAQIPELTGLLKEHFYLPEPK